LRRATTCCCRACAWNRRAATSRWTIWRRSTRCWRGAEGFFFSRRCSPAPIPGSATGEADTLPRFPAEHSARAGRSVFRSAGAFVQAVNVLCIKWGRKYGPDYVNKLHSMVSRHLHRPFRFVCLTDDGEGIDPRIEVKPIPAVGFDQFDQRQPWTFGHGWLKLTSFADPLYDLQGRTLFLDLDIVIVDTL